MPKINRTRYAILGMLTYGPMSGYDLKKAFDHSITHFWNEDYGHIYPELRKLERDGLVTRIVIPAEGKPARHLYTVAEAGRAELDGWLLLPAGRPNLRIELLLKVFFGARLPKENLREKLEAEKRFCEETLAVFRGIAEHLRKLEPKEGGTVGDFDFRKSRKFGLLSLSYGREYYEGVARWCDEALEVIEEEGD